MMFLKGGGLASVLFLVFFGWIFIANTSEERIERTCKPTQWVGKMVTSLTDLTIPQYSRKADTWIDNVEFSCQYAVWRLFYEEAWMEAEKNNESADSMSINSDKHGAKHHD